jgi:hypothetical protein
MRFILRLTIVDELPTIEGRPKARLKSRTHIDEPAIAAPNVSEPVIDGLIEALPPEHGAR